MVVNFCFICAHVRYSYKNRGMIVYIIFVEVVFVFKVGRNDSYFPFWVLPNVGATIMIKVQISLGKTTKFPFFSSFIMLSNKKLMNWLLRFSY